LTRTSLPGLLDDARLPLGVLVDATREHLAALLVSILSSVVVDAAEVGGLPKERAEAIDQELHKFIFELPPQAFVELLSQVAPLVRDFERP
jgi:hypothetical protein